ncbi:helix-turn-helix domain-containing protein [Caulobacter sp. LjRoot300]|uniref:helix-turn-helix domain-containing protein n=1 Tax=Caulobacter sp. LjRoot300 TaxID=3342321 RepID=UPI003F4FDCF5
MRDAHGEPSQPKSLRGAGRGGWLAHTYVGQIERGTRNPRLAMVEKFAKVLAVDGLAL